MTDGGRLQDQHLGDETKTREWFKEELILSVMHKVRILMHLQQVWSNLFTDTQHSHFSFGLISAANADRGLGYVTSLTSALDTTSPMLLKLDDWFPNNVLSVLLIPWSDAGSADPLQKLSYWSSLRLFVSHQTAAHADGAAHSWGMFMTNWLEIEGELVLICIHAQKIYLLIFTGILNQINF